MSGLAKGRPDGGPAPRGAANEVRVGSFHFTPGPVTLAPKQAPGMKKRMKRMSTKGMASL